MAFNDSDLILSKGLDEKLPSQEGKRGRPRVNGRATITVSKNLEKSAFDLMKPIQKLTSEFFKLKVSNLILYGTETNVNQVTFVVPGIDKDTRVNLILKLKTDSVTKPSATEEKTLPPLAPPPPVATHPASLSIHFEETTKVKIEAKAELKTETTQAIEENETPETIERDFPIFAKALVEIRKIIAEDNIEINNTSNNIDTNETIALDASDMTIKGTTRWLKSNG